MMVTRSFAGFVISLRASVDFVIADLFTLITSPDNKGGFFVPVGCLKSITKFSKYALPFLFILTN